MNEGIYDSSIDASTDIEIGTNHTLVQEYRDPQVGFTPFVFHCVVETKVLSDSVEQSTRILRSEHTAFIPR